MPEEHPFDKAMREAAEKEWEEAKRTPYEISPTLQAAIEEAARNKPASVSAAKPERTESPSFLLLLQRLFQQPLTWGAIVVVIAALICLPSLVSRRDQLAMYFPSPKGGTPTGAGTLVEPSVVVSVNWKKRTLQIPLKSGGKLTGEFKPATNGPPLPLAFDVTLSGTNAGQPVNGDGQLMVMPQYLGDKLDRFSTNALLWLKLDLKLRIGGQEEPLYRVFGAP
jgi:hypothetical protein